jgi:repressor LexA
MGTIMKKQLTERQEEILTFIQQFQQECGYPPTLREIGKKFDISSTFGVKRHLDALSKKGYLNILSNASRGISITKDESLGPIPINVSERESNRIPIIGRVAAGSPILSEENIDGSVLIDPAFLRKSENCFALKVKGESMIDAGIYEGDLVIISPQPNANNGDIIVARINDEVTVNTYELKNQVVKLIPQNKNYIPIVVKNKEDFSIVGKVTGVLRWLN